MGSKAICALIIIFTLTAEASVYDTPFTYVETPDGAKLALYRISEGELGPVVLVHGLWVNRYNFLLGPEGGLAKYLADKKFSVFLLEVRGAGNSTTGDKNDFKSIAFDDFALVLERVENITGKIPQAVGHSMGGMIIGTYLANTRSPRLRAAVIVSSPARFHKGIWFYGMASRFPNVSLGISRLPYEELARFFSPILGEKNPYAGLGYADGTIGGPTLREAARKAIDKPPKELMKDFGSFVSNGCICDSNGNSYIEDIKYAKTPLLILAGAKDELAPPESVRRWFELAGSEDKEFIVVSRANGFSIDAGHGDIILGDYASGEVYPIIERWLSHR